jgi:SET domain-containing protein
MYNRRNVEIRDCGTKGHGLFAAEDIGADAFVMEYHGEIIGESEFVRRSTESGHR